MCFEIMGNACEKIYEIIFKFLANSWNNRVQVDMQVVCYQIKKKKFLVFKHEAMEVEFVSLEKYFRNAVWKRKFLLHWKKLLTKEVI